MIVCAKTMSKEYLSDQKLVISATTSQRRQEAITILPMTDSCSLPGPVIEKDDLNLANVARDKNDFVIQLLRTYEQLLNTDQLNEGESNFPVELAPLILSILTKINEYNGEYQVIGGDIQTAVPTIDHRPQHQSWRLQAHGKPAEVHQTQAYFEQMSHLDANLYRLFAGSSIVNYSQRVDGVNEVRANQAVTVYLRPEMVKFLATDHGFDQYLTDFAEFYQDNLPTPNSPLTTPQHVSAGFSLPVLIKEQAVAAIKFDGQKVDLSTASEDFLKKVIYTVAIGYSPKVLQEISPLAYQFTIDNWSWLQQMVVAVSPHGK